MGDRRLKVKGYVQKCKPRRPPHLLALGPRPGWMSDIDPGPAPHPRRSLRRPYEHASARKGASPLPANIAPAPRCIKHTHPHALNLTRRRGRDFLHGGGLPQAAAHCQHHQGRRRGGARLDALAQEGRARPPARRAAARRGRRGTGEQGAPRRTAQHLSVGLPPAVLWRSAEDCDQDSHAAWGDIRDAWPAGGGVCILR
jgi:hypothetical protein